MRAWSDPPVPDLNAHHLQLGGRWSHRPVLRLFDTATGSATPLRTPAHGDPARMYVCGITPYDATHLGHAATYLSFDLLNRAWRDRGHEVHYVQNVTDVDDPLLERAARDGVRWTDLAEQEIGLFRDDLVWLRVLAPRDYIGVVEAMDEVIEFIAKLIAGGAAYRVDDPEYPDIYFRHDATAQFGYASRCDRPTMLALFAERGGDPDRPGKLDPLDPLLWRAARPGEPSWDGELGPGRPGWHVECAAIAYNRLGARIDVQGGGSDLAFPHHEFSAAHVEAAIGSYPFARHYCHAGMIGLHGEKMSKSKGNLVLVSGLRADGADPMAVRLALLAGHWRADRMWTPESLDAAAGRLRRWRAAAARPDGPDGAVVIGGLRERLADDLDSPGALAAVDDWSDAVLAGAGDRADGSPAAVAAAVDALLGVTLSGADG
jgi:L-cysteine:1D-myo-inositol 2-amino-2-deoxy-alpha-D-glucopyranoside ligase